MRYTSIICAIFLIFAAHYPAISQNAIKGIVLDDQGKPLSGAVVELISTSLSYTTLADGKFSLSPTKIRSTSLSYSNCRNQMKISTSSIELNNIQSQKVTLILFDLRGKTIGKLYDGFLSSGQYRFTIPAFTKNQTVILQTQLGATKESFKISGSFFSKKMADNNSGRTIESKTAVAITNKVLVTHTLYDDKSVEVNSQDDTLVIRVNRKLSLHTLNQIRIGDTLSFGNKGVRVSLDSIHDERCGCDALCTWEGNASLYFTLTINSVSHPVILKTYDKRDISLAGYTIYLGCINPCPQILSSNYIVDVAVFPIDNPKVLFLEQFSTKDGTVVSGYCDMFKIDFPMYNYSSTSGILENYRSVAITDSTKVIVGNGFSLLGDIGGGISSDLKMFNSIPFIYNGTLTIDEIQENGTVKVHSAGEMLSLAPGESWNSDSTYLETTSDCQRNTTVKDRISNFGFLMPYQIKQGN